MTKLEELEKQAKQAEQRIEELKLIREYKEKIQLAKDLEAEVEPGFFKKAKKAMQKTGKGIDTFADFMSLNPPKKEKKPKKDKFKVVYKGLKL